MYIKLLQTHFSACKQYFYHVGDRSQNPTFTYRAGCKQHDRYSTALEKPT